MGWHTTWFVNSLSHIYGKREFETRDDSTNNWFVALLTFGEGWHNNHHAFPTSARHGLKWYQFDMNWIAIRIFEKLGWARDIRVYQEKPAGGAETSRLKNSNRMDKINRIEKKFYRDKRDAKDKEEKSLLSPPSL